MPTTRTRPKPDATAPGRCHYCYGEAADGASWCEACSDARKEWYAGRKVAGLCCQTGCRRKARRGRVYCARCLDRKNLRTREWKRKARAAEKRARKAAGAKR